MSFIHARTERCDITLQISFLAGCSGSDALGRFLVIHRAAVRMSLGLIGDISHLPDLADFLGRLAFDVFPIYFLGAWH